MKNQFKFKKLKVCTVLGTRPEIIRLSRTLPKLDIFCNHILIHTGQNFDYELNKVFFDDLKIRKPDYFLNAATDNSVETISKIMFLVEKILIKEKPDAFLVLGDTNSCMSAISAKRRQIPVFHVEAGNRCYDQRVPEEINRKIIDHIADINLTYSSIARENLLREGLPTDMIIKIGSPLCEVIKFYRPKIEKSKILKTLKLKENQFFLISCHREENIDSETNFEKFSTMLNSLALKFNFPLVVSTHPRTRKKIQKTKKKFHPLIKFLKPLSFTDYVKLQMKCKAVLSDSGSITEEASILNLKALNIRETNERQEGMEEAVVPMTGFNMERIFLLDGA